MRVLLCLMVLCACGDDDGSADAGGDAGSDVGADTGTDTGVDVGFDAFDAGPDIDVCDELGLARVPIQAGTGNAFGDVAADFTVETTDGPWTLSDHWTGCDSYVFVNWAREGLYRTQPAQLIDRSARNAHYFFTSYERDAAGVRARVEALQARVEDALTLYPPEDAVFWRERLHFVVTPLLDIEGSPGERARNQPGISEAFGIDREQRFDPVGSLAAIGAGGFVPNLGMAAYASHYYNYREALRLRIEEEAAATTEVVFVDETEVTDRSFVRDVTLPDAAAMAGFDTLEIDVRIDCKETPAGCSEWDRIALLEICLNDACDERREIVRWITPYARPGVRQWIMDATPFLAYVQDGGAQKIRVVMGPDWEEATPRDVRMALRLRNTGLGRRPVGAVRAWTGGAFDASYAVAHPPFDFTPPDTATRVELVAIVSGHGQTDTDNCAEWCNHEHTFSVNGRGRPHVIEYPREAGRAFGCADRTAEGVVPGQYGNWAPSRAGWCPGFPVETVRFDITDQVTLGEANEVTYTATFDGMEPRGGNISLSTYVVWYE